MEGRLKLRLQSLQEKKLPVKLLQSLVWIKRLLRLIPLSLMASPTSFSLSYTEAVSTPRYPILKYKLENSAYRIHFMLMRFRILDPVWKKWTRIRIQAMNISLRFIESLNKSILHIFSYFFFET